MDQQLSLLTQSLHSYQSSRAEMEQQVVKRFEILNQRMVSMEQANQQLNQQLEAQQYQATRDPLTGIANRAAWNAHLPVEHARLTRSKEPLLLAIIDIDFFKRINDNYGHIAGDKALKIIAQTLARSLRKTDFLARYGGEEFVMLLTNTPLEQGWQLLDKTRQSIAQTPFHFRGEPVQITFSAGIGQLLPDETIEQGFSRVDQALYQAKETGRNRVNRAR